jgi:acetyl-CoA carboxylase/biotin carboxylase 1
MIMPLIAAEDGIAQLIKQPGATLAAGDILGILSLDDPSRVHHAKPFDGQLPQLGLPNIVGNKPFQRFAYLKEVLANILAGYDNQSIMQSSIKELIAVLRNPEKQVRSSRLCRDVFPPASRRPSARRSTTLTPPAPSSRRPSAAS